MQDQKCRMPPVTTSANPQLVPSSSEDPSSFDNETGCMKGIFQLFDRHHSFSSRRYGSKRITTENADPTLNNKPQLDQGPEENKTPRLSFYFRKPSPTGTPTQASVNGRQTEQNVPRVSSSLDNEDIACSSFCREKPQIKGRDRHRYSVDGTRDPPQVSTCAPRLSADGRDVTQRQKAELQAKTSEGMQRGLSVVARLMGLEEIPSPSPSLQNVQHIKPPSREAKLIQGLLQYTPPRLATEPAPRQSGKYASLQEKGGRPMRNQGEGCQEPMPRPKLALSPKHLLMDGMPHIFRQQVPRDASNNCHPNVTKHFMEESTPTMPPDTNPSPGPEPLHGNMAHRLRQLRLRNLVQERKTLKHILEALQLKGLLHAPRHKQTAGTNFFSDSKLLLVPKGGQGRRPRLQPKGEIVSSPKTPRSAQVGNIKLLASPSVREPGSPGLPRPGSPNGVAFGSGSKRMPENVRSPQAKSMPQSQLSQELVKGRTAGIIGPESPRLRRPILSDSKSTNSTVEEYPKYQSLKGPVDVSILKSKQLSKLAKEREKCNGVLFEKSNFSKNDQMNSGPEQPSPVSVLDSTAFEDEECSLSSRAEEHAIQVTSGLTRDGSPTTWSIHMQGHIIDPALLVQSERLQREEKTKDRLYTFQQWCNTNEEQRRESVDHHLLFDTVNEILVRKCQLESLYSQPWVMTSRIFKFIQEKSKGQNLVREVWEELQGTACTSLNDGGDNIQSILQKDLGCNNGHEWSDYGLMHGELGLELEQLIFKDLVDETVRELKCCSSSGDGACSRNSLPFRKEATARRQLHFTN
ncbi:unnamed protein product [Sphagnum troendelagicum]